MDSSNHIGGEVKELNNMIAHFFERERAGHAHAPTMVQGRIIWYLYDNQEQDLFQRDIEKRFSIRRSTVTNVLKLMEKNGLIERESVPYDGRLKRLTLTAKAIDIHLEFIHDLDRIENQLRNGLTDEEVNQFFALVAKIKNNTLSIPFHDEGAPR